MSLFDHYPLFHFQEIKDSNLYYDVDRNELVSTVDDGARVSDTYRICGKKSTMNGIFHFLRAKVPPNPPYHVYKMLEQEWMRDAPTDADVHDRAMEIASGPTMKYMGPSCGGVSPHGITTDVLTSALHKYIRRGNYAKAMWCLVERDYFNDLASMVDDRGLKAFSTRMYNRLGPIISCEDVGLGNAFLPIYVESVISKVCECSNVERRKLLFSLTHNLVRSEKCRELSHVRYVFHTALSDDEVIHKHASIYGPYLDDTSAFATVNDFMRLYDARSDLCFIPFFKLFYDGGARIADMTAIAKHVMRDATYTELFSVLFKWHKRYKFKERWLFIAQMILVSLRGITVRKQVEEVGCYSIFWKKNMDGEECKIDDYVYDIHTKQGVSMHKTAADFATEGSLVMNEFRGTNKLYKDLYIRSKTHRSTWSDCFTRKNVAYQSATVDSSSIAKHPRGQILTSKHKKYTCIGSEFVFKGPWGPECEQKMRNVYARRECILACCMDPHIMVYDFASDEKEDIWFVTPNMATTPPDRWKIEKKQGKLESEAVDVVDRESMGYTQLSSMPSEEQYNILFNRGLFKAYIFMALIGAGDMGPWNCISNGTHVKIIDYEDDSGRTEMTCLSSVFARHSIAAMNYASDKITPPMIDDLDSFIHSDAIDVDALKKIVIAHRSSIDIDKNMGMIQSMLTTVREAMSK